MGSNVVKYGKKLINKRNLLKSRMSDYLKEKGLTHEKICTDAASKFDYLISPSESTLRGYHSDAKDKVAVEYLITLHDVYEAPYDYLFGVQDTTYEEKGLKSKLATHAYEKIVEISQDSFSNQILNCVIENYIPTLIDKIKATIIMKAISDELIDSDNTLESDLFDNSLETDLHLYIRQMVKDVINDKAITLDHKVVRDTYGTILEGLEERADTFHETYEILKDAYTYDKEYDDVIKEVLAKAVALKEKLNEKWLTLKRLCSGIVFFR